MNGLATARRDHALAHSNCKTIRGPHEVYQRLCKDPCHKKPGIFGTSKYRMNDGYYEAKGLDPKSERAKREPLNGSVR